MKKLIFFILVIVSTVGVFGQSESKLSGNQDNKFMPLIEFKGDTLGYVQHNFIDNNKQKYIGKELNALLNDVEIPIKSYLPCYSEPDPSIVLGLFLQFHTLKQADHMANSNSTTKPVNIIIICSPPFKRDSVAALWTKSNGEWLDAERKYYGKQIIGDVMTTKWGK